MSRWLFTDTANALTGDVVNLFKPCLREEEIAQAREEIGALVRRHLQRFAERLRREHQRLGRPAAGWGEGGGE